MKSSSGIYAPPKVDYSNIISDPKPTLKKEKSSIININGSPELSQIKQNS
jgi:hypothetical protein